MPQTLARAAVFDLGNTLWFAAREPSTQEMDSVCAELLRPWLAARAGVLPAPAETLIREIWDAYDQAWRIEVGRGSLRDPAIPFLVRGAFATHGVEVDDEFAAGWHRASWIGARRFGVELYPDALDVLRELRGRRIRIGINSNRPCTTGMMMGDLADMGIAPYIDAAVCSGETGYLKPHPSTFEHIVEALAVAPQDAVMIGDSPEADMSGARAAGMRTVLKLNGRYGAPPCLDADFTIHDLGELLALPVFGGAGAVAVESLTPHEDNNEDRY